MVSRGRSAGRVDCARAGAWSSSRGSWRGQMWVWRETMISSSSRSAPAGKVVREDVVSIAPGSKDKERLEFKGSRLSVLSEEDAFFKGWKMRNKVYLIEPTGKPY